MEKHQSSTSKSLMTNKDYVKLKTDYNWQIWN